MKKSDQNYNYLLRLHSVVDEYLADTPSKQENLPDIVVSFCAVTEKILKIKLHSENPILVYESVKFKDNDLLVAIVKERETSMDTIRIKDTLYRYKQMFDDEFSNDEIQVFIDIYNARNHFIHGYKSDDDVLSDKENLVKKMGTVWERISKQALFIFGNDIIKANKPKKKYSEEELEKVLIEEVRKKIKSNLVSEFYPFHGVTAERFDVNEISSIDHLTVSQSIMGIAGGEQCPRCGNYGFYLDAANPEFFSVVYSSSKNYTDLYKCKKCNLELTRKEYEIARKIKK